MKKFVKRGYFLLFAIIGMLLFDMQAQAKDGDTIKTGIFAGDINLSGMTASEAKVAVEEYVAGLKTRKLQSLRASWGLPGQILSWWMKRQKSVPAEM